MGMLRPRHVALLLIAPLPAWLMACAASSPSPPTSAERQGATIQQQAGYGQPAPAATASPGAALDIKALEQEAPAEDLAGRLTQFDKAEQALGLALEARSRDEVWRADAPKSPPGQVAKGDSAAPLQLDPCLVACAALASMKRSADHVCGMAGESDAACTGARTRVSRATERVVAACPACAAK